MRIKLDLSDMGAGRSPAAEKPYPSWNEMMARLHRERPGQLQPQAAAAPPREWHDLVADMILKR